MTGILISSHRTGEKPAIGWWLLLALLVLLGRIPEWLEQASAALLGYLPLMLAIPATIPAMMEANQLSAAKGYRAARVLGDRDLVAELI